MPTVPTPVLIVTVYIQCQGGRMSNVTFWEVTSPPTTQDNINAIATAAATELSPLYRAYMSQQANFLGVVALYRDGANSLEAGSAAGAGTGNANGQAMPDQNAVVVDKQTGKFGRQYLGRYFLGGIATTALDPDNSNETSTQAPDFPAFQALGEYLAADREWGGTQCHARHWDRKSNTLIPVTQCAVRSRIASQRRRRKRQLDLALPS